MSAKKLSNNNTVHIPIMKTNSITSLYHGEKEYPVGLCFTDVHKSGSKEKLHYLHKCLLVVNNRMEINATFPMVTVFSTHVAIKITFQKVDKLQSGHF